MFNFQIILLVPVIVAASVAGTKGSLAISTLSTLFLLIKQICLTPDASFFVELQSELVIIATMYVVGWFVGAMTEADTKYNLKLEENLQSLREEIRRRALLEKQLVKLSSALEQSPNIVVITDTLGNIDYVNRMFTLVTDYPLEKVKGGNLCNIFDKPFSYNGQKLNSICADIFNHINSLNAPQENNHVINREIRFHSKSGEERTGLLSIEEIKLDVERFAVAVINDVTDRKRAEETLKEERLRLFSLFECLPAYVYLQAPDHSIRFANRCFRDFFGDPEERHCYEVLDERCEPCEECKTFSVFKTDNPIKWEWNRSDGKVFQVFDYPYNDVDGTPLVLEMGVDVTENKKFEKEIARLDRLHLVGEMAAGIGHEIRNPMTTVRGFLQFLGEKKENDHQKEYFDLMIEELDRANSIITEYLSLAKNKAVKLEKKNLNSILETILPLILSDAIKTEKHVHLETGEIPDLLVDENEIRQVILNLSRNGLEAMSFKGVLTIKTFSDNDEAVLAVQDQGKGMAPDVLEKIGTPFFTTKDNGTGLGLAVCYSIASRHNANIKIDTGPRGTTFFVRFKVKQAS